MCRSMKTLFNFKPPATELEIRDASLQVVRKLMPTHRIAIIGAGLKQFVEVRTEN
jgi:hypothetical protein